MSNPDTETADVETYFFPDFLPDNPSHFISVQLHNGILDHNFLRHSAVYVAIEGCSRPQSDTGGKKERDIMCVSGKGHKKSHSRRPVEVENARDVVDNARKFRI